MVKKKEKTRARNSFDSSTVAMMEKRCCRVTEHVFYLFVVCVLKIDGRGRLLYDA